ncbi:aldose epimerase family protein [Glaciecola sp. SC05]|uniref:aldose epimerase family protein n=1 Tax=Glaciecola sp. SC05 TaxID=1987355 RepID=UPI003526E30A
MKAGKLQRVILSNKHNMQVELVDFGARIVSIKVPNKQDQIIETTYSDKRDQQIIDDVSYKGATCGRVANRINNAAFYIGKEHYQLHANEGSNMLHGGAQGFSKRHWRLAEHRKTYAEDTAIFEIASPDNDQGFPGNMLARVSYRLLATNELRVEFSASCDKLCPINMCNHVYFNLGEKSIADLSLQVNAKQVLAVDKHSIPTGLFNQVDSATDLNAPVMLEDILKQRDLDDCFVLKANNAGLATDRGNANEAARLVSHKNGIALIISTNQCGLQVYTGNYLAQKHAAIALEAQGFTDAVNQASMQAEWVGPKRPYTKFVSYRFENC